MKKAYENPIMSISLFCAENVVTTVSGAYAQTVKEQIDVMGNYLTQAEFRDIFEYGQ